MRRRTVVIALLIACVLAVAVFAATRVTANPGTLNDRSWTLTRLTVGGREQPLVPAHPVTLRFRAQDRQVAGSGGCNSYGGPYLIVGDTLRITDLSTTLMACVATNTFGTDAGVMEQESAYLQALGRVESYHLDGDTLILQGDSGQTRLVFRPGG